jgi:hypothetical protein
MDTPWHYDHPYAPGYNFGPNYPKPTIPSQGSDGNWTSYLDGPPWLPIWYKVEDPQGRPIAGAKITLYVGTPGGVYTIVRPTRQDGTQVILLPTETTAQSIAAVVEAKGFEKTCHNFDPILERQFQVQMDRVKGRSVNGLGQEVTVPFSVRVLSSHNDEPIPNAHVVVSGKMGAFPISIPGQTDGNGYWSLPPAPYVDPADVEVTVEARDFKSVKFMAKVPDPNTRVVHMELLEHAPHKQVGHKWPLGDFIYWAGGLAALVLSIHGIVQITKGK